MSRSLFGDGEQWGWDEADEENGYCKFRSKLMYLFFPGIGEARGV